MFKVSIKDSVTGFAQEMGESFRTRRFNPALAAGVLKMVKGHIRALPKNKMGWPSQNYWQEAAKSAFSTTTPTGFTITIPQAGFNMHVTGEPHTIEPRNARLLTIPAVPEAYGRRAGEFQNLRIAYYRKGGQLVPFALVEKSEPGQKGPHKIQLRTGKSVAKGETGKVIYWLRDHVTTHPYDPSPVPSEEEIQQTMTETMDLRMAAIQARHDS